MRSPRCARGFARRLAYKQTCRRKPFGSRSICAAQTLDFAPPPCDGFAFSRVEIKGKRYHYDHSKNSLNNQAFSQPSCPRFWLRGNPSAGSCLFRPAFSLPAAQVGFHLRLERVQQGGHLYCLPGHRFNQAVGFVRIGLQVEEEGPLLQRPERGVIGDEFAVILPIPLPDAERGAIVVEKQGVVGRGSFSLQEGQDISAVDDAVGRRGCASQIARNSNTRPMPSKAMKRSKLACSVG